MLLQQITLQKYKSFYNFEFKKIKIRNQIADQIIDLGKIMTSSQ